VAERAAALDIVSGGRLELGTARSSTWTELGGFGSDPDTTKKTWDEYVRALPKMWTQERFAWDGVAFSMPERTILPKPRAAAASAPLGHRHEPGHRARRRRPRHRLPRRRGGGLSPSRSAARASTIGASAVRSVVERRQTTASATLNFLYCMRTRASRPPTGMRMLGLFGFYNANLLPTREAYPTRAYQSLGALAPRRARTPAVPAIRAAFPRASRSAIPSASSTRSGDGSRSASTHQLHRQRRRDGAAARGPRELRLFASEVMALLPACALSARRLGTASAIDPAGSGSVVLGKTRVSTLSRSYVVAAGERPAIWGFECALVGGTVWFARLVLLTFTWTFVAWGGANKRHPLRRPLRPPVPATVAAPNRRQRRRRRYRRAAEQLGKQDLRELVAPVALYRTSCSPRCCRDHERRSGP
jgi:hypothetical protein